MNLSKIKLFAILFIGMAFFSFTDQQPTDDSIQLTSEEMEKLFIMLINLTIAPIL